MAKLSKLYLHPPRRFGGMIHDVLSTVSRTISELRQSGIHFQNKRVLDLGCGNGRLAAHLHNEVKEYLGIDVIRGCIDWCEHTYNFLGITNAKFIHMDYHNDRYNPTGRLEPDKFKLEMGKFDIVLCLSLFTHLGTEQVASKYFEQCVDSLDDKGLLCTTWFTNPPNELSEGTARTVYSYDFIMSLIRKHNLVLLNEVGGKSNNWHDQVRLLCCKQ